MVVLSAALLTKSGKVLVARQFVEITRIRIEGLLTAFPKLLSSGQREHTFIDTESVRYVYQPLENYFILIITNKTSNIVEDLQTIQLLAKLIPDICGSLSESSVKEKQFELVFGIDEMISAGGHSENITLQQIRMNMEMESHEEKLHNMILESKRAAAKDDMKRHTIRIKEEQRERARMERGGMGSAQSSFKNTMASAFDRNSPRADTISSAFPSSSLPTSPYGSGVSDFASKTVSKSVGMKLGAAAGSTGKNFMDAMVAEDDLSEIAPMAAPIESVAKPQIQAAVNKDPIGVVLEEKITVQLTREGNLEQLEIKGNLFVSVNDPASGRCRLKLRASPLDEITIQTHPKVDKKLFDKESVLGLKDATKSFPPNRVGVLRWSLKTQDDSFLPLNITCWPEDEGGGKVNVSIEYLMDRSEMTLENVDIRIPLQSANVPNVSHIDGNYHHLASERALLWRMDQIDASNNTGTLEFSIQGSNVDDFFPVSISFHSRNVYCDMDIKAVYHADDPSATIEFGSQKLLSTETYQIL